MQEARMYRKRDLATVPPFLGQAINNLLVRMDYQYIKEKKSKPFGQSRKKYFLFKFMSSRILGGKGSVILVPKC